MSSSGPRTKSVVRRSRYWGLARADQTLRASGISRSVGYRTFARSFLDGQRLGIRMVPLLGVPGVEVEDRTLDERRRFSVTCYYLWESFVQCCFRLSQAAWSFVDQLVRPFRYHGQRDISKVPYIRCNCGYVVAHNGSSPVQCPVQLGGSGPISDECV